MQFIKLVTVINQILFPSKIKPWEDIKESSKSKFHIFIDHGVNILENLKNVSSNIQ